MPLATVPVPKWTPQQVLPPNDASNPVSAARSPYRVNLAEFARIFATSWERCTILKGYLLFRSELHAVGLVDGFQWIDGSFTENVEVLESRAPGDVDVVTFVNDPNDLGAGLAPDLLIHRWVKANRRTDHYWVELHAIDPPDLVSLSAYWYSMWSHRRNSLWKGFLEVDLGPANDALANQIVDAQMLLYPQPNPLPGVNP
jgi:hypothetical protein